MHSFTDTFTLSLNGSQFQILCYIKHKQTKNTFTHSFNDSRTLAVSSRSWNVLVIFSCVSFDVLYSTDRAWQKKTCNTLFNPMGSGGISKEIFKTLQSESHLFQLGHLLPDFPLGFSKVALLCFYVEGSHLGREVVVLERRERKSGMLDPWICFHVGDKSWRIQSSRKFYASNFISTLPPSGMLSQHSWTFAHWPTHPPDVFIHFFLAYFSMFDSLFVLLSILQISACSVSILQRQIALIYLSVGVTINFSEYIPPLNLRFHSFGVY